MSAQDITAPLINPPESVTRVAKPASKRLAWVYEIFQYAHWQTESHLELVARGTTAAAGERKVSMLQRCVACSTPWYSEIGVHTPSLRHLDVYVRLRLRI